MIGSAMRSGFLVDLVDFQEGDGFDAGPDRPPCCAPSMAERDSASMAMPETVLITANASAPASRQARVLARMYGLIGRQLDNERLGCDFAAGGDHDRGHFWIVAEFHPARLDVGTGDIDLDAVDRRVVEAARHLGVFLDGGPGHVSEETSGGKIQAWQHIADDRIHSGVLQADRIQQAVRRFRQPVRRIAEAGFERGSLEADRAHLVVRRTPRPECIRHRNRRNPKARPAESEEAGRKSRLIGDLSQACIISNVEGRVSSASTA